MLPSLSLVLVKATSNVTTVHMEMQSWNIKTWSEGTWLGMRRRRRCLRWALSRPKATWAGHGKGEGSGRFLSPAPCRKLSPWGWREWCAAVCTVEMMTTGLRNRPRRWPRCPKPKNTKQGKRWISFHHLSRISQLHWSEAGFYCVDATTCFNI